MQSEPSESVENSKDLTTKHPLYDLGALFPSWPHLFPHIFKIAPYQLNRIQILYIKYYPSFITLPHIASKYVGFFWCHDLRKRAHCLENQSTNPNFSAAEGWLAHA